MGEYFTLYNKEDFPFIKMPKDLLNNSAYSELSIDSICLYSVFLDRIGISIKNNWADDNGHVYIIYTIEEVCKTLRCGKTKAIELMSILEEADLLERKRCGQGKPNIIFLKTIEAPHANSDVNSISRCSEVRKTVIKKSENQIPRSPKNALQGIRKTNVKKYVKQMPRSAKDDTLEYRNSISNKNELNNNNLNDINPIGSNNLTDEIKRQISYQNLVRDYQSNLIDEVVCIIADVLSTTEPNIYIASSLRNTEMVKERYKQITSEHIAYVLDEMKRSTSKKSNILRYLQTSLYNSVATMNAFYIDRVNCDLNGY